MSQKIALLREGIVPPDARVALTPRQCRRVMQQFEGVEIFQVDYPERCFSAKEYASAGVAEIENPADSDILLGIKEVPVHELIAYKTYLFFSHTIKKQPKNKALLRECLRKKIKLIDYECLTWENGSRVLGFGRFAGIVGAYNGLLTWGRKTGDFTLKPAYEMKTYEAVKKEVVKLKLPPLRIIVTGDGRVSHGCMELLRQLNIREVSHQEFLTESYSAPVFVQLRSEHYYARRDGREWDKSDFYIYPEEYESTFLPYTRKADILMNGAFWNERIEPLFTKEEAKDEDFKIRVIADISCDINGGIPLTVRATTIPDPAYGWHALGEKETAPYLPHTIDMMTVGNLPCELPADASEEFGESLLKYVLPRLLADEPDAMIERATICADGVLTPKFQYLTDYVE